MSWHNMNEWSGSTLLKNWWDKVRDNLAYLKDETVLLGGRIGDLTHLATTEKTNLVSAANELNSYIAAETSARTNADTALQDKIGTLTNLDTSVKTDLVSAVNEVKGGVSTEMAARAGADTALQNQLGTLSNLDTTVKTDLVSAINEVDGEISAETTAREGADSTLYNTLSGMIGILINLDTSQKNNLVTAINEVLSRLQGEASARSGQCGLLQDQIGTLANLDTSVKTDLVSAANEINGKTQNVCHYKNKATYSQLQGIIHSEEYVPALGDVWHIYAGSGVIKNGDTLIATGGHDSTHTDGYDGGAGDDQTYWLEGYEFIVISGVVDLSGKQDKTTITDLPVPTTASITMANNTETRFGELTSLTLSLPNTTPDDYISSVIFTSGNTATNLVYPATISMLGEDCTGGVFTPGTGKRYTVILSYDGIYITGAVGGVSTT